MITLKHFQNLRNKKYYTDKPFIVVLKRRFIGGDTFVTNNYSKSFKWAILGYLPEGNKPTEVYEFKAKTKKEGIEVAKLLLKEQLKLNNFVSKTTFDNDIEGFEHLLKEIEKGSKIYSTKELKEGQKVYEIKFEDYGYIHTIYSKNKVSLSLEGYRDLERDWTTDINELLLPNFIYFH